MQLTVKEMVSELRKRREVHQTVQCKAVSVQSVPDLRVQNTELKGAIPKVQGQITSYFNSLHNSDPSKRKKLMDNFNCPTVFKQKELIGVNESFEAIEGYKWKGVRISSHSESNSRTNHLKRIVDKEPVSKNQSIIES